MADVERERLLATLVRDPHEAHLPERATAMLRYAAKLTLTPGAMTAHDLEPLRAAGLDDRAIHDLCAIVAYYAFVNRIADGLGVELEERFTPDATLDLGGNG